MEINGIAANNLPVAERQLPATLKSPKAANDAASAKKVGREFEAMFVGLMLKSMRETVGEDKLTGGGRGEEMFRSLLDQQYADTAAQGGGIGLAKMIEKELTRGYHGTAPAPAKGGENAS
jgi:peptidoglycan hydrolase FlgJ